MLFIEISSFGFVNEVKHLANILSEFSIMINIIIYATVSTPKYIKSLPIYFKFNT